MGLFSEKLIVLDIGSRAVKALLIRVDPGSVSVEKVARKSWHHSYDFSLQENDSPHLLTSLFSKENILQFLEEHFPDQKEILYSLPVESVYVRDLFIPVKDKKRLHELIPFEAENHLHVPAEELEILGRVWRVEEEGSRVLAFAVSKQDILNRMSLFTNTDYRVRMLSVDSVGLASLTSLLPEEVTAERTIAQIDIGGEYSFLNVIHNGEPLFMRMIPLGGDDVTRMISSLTNLPSADAEALKEELFLLSLEDDFNPDPSILKEAKLTKKGYHLLRAGMCEWLKEFELEVTRSLLALPVSKPEEYYLSGASSSIQGLAAYLEERLSLPVKNYPFTLLDQCPLEPYATAVGLAGEYRKRENLKIDFLKTPTGRSIRGNVFHPEYFLTSLLLAGFALLLFLLTAGINMFINYRTGSAARLEMLKIAKQIPALDSSENPLQDAENLCRVRLEAYRGVGGKEKVLDLMQIVGEKIPTGDAFPFKLRSFSYSPGSVSIEGESSSLAKGAELERYLKENPRFSSVEVTGRAAGTTQKVILTVRLKLTKETMPTGGECR